MEQKGQMNISFLTTSFPRFDGDYSGNFVCRYAQELSKQSVNLEVIAPDDPASLPLSENFKVVRFQYFLPRSWQTLAYGSGIVNRTSVTTWIQLPFMLLSFFLTSIRSASKTQLVHAFWSASGLIALAIRCFKPRPVVVTLWGSDKLALRIPVLSNLIFRLLKTADAIVCEENSLKSHLLSRGFNREKIFLISNGIDKKLFHPGDSDQAKRDLRLSDGQRIILSVGSLNKNKNHSLLIQAFAKIPTSNTSWHLYIIGDGEERLNLEKQILDLEISQKVKLLGIKDHCSLPQWLKAADIFVLPSLNEGTPNVLVEAMACGLPIIASKVGGIPDLIQDKVEGLLFESDSKAELVEKLDKLMQDKELQISLGRAATKKVNSQFSSWENQAEKLLSIYQQLLSSSTH